VLGCSNFFLSFSNCNLRIGLWVEQDPFERYKFDGVWFCFLNEREPLIRGFLYKPAIPIGEPDDVELRQFHDVWYAIRRLWPDKLDEVLANNIVNAWIVREPASLVGIC